ncbi:Mov34/MPN/PAD-1 family protein [Rhizobium leguminosarum]|nr:Mov34/MPN/PAD-1 family protein [Rhizobium leguminosarum]
MINAALRAKTNETGGILIGFIDQGEAVVCEANGMPSGSRFGLHSFWRAAGHLSYVLRKRWQEKRHYLGEWHTHPNGSPTPSDTDRKTMEGISRNPSYACPEPLLIIVGTSGSTASLSFAVFPKDEGFKALSDLDCLNVRTKQADG